MCGLRKFPTVLRESPGAFGILRSLPAIDQKSPEVSGTIRTLPTSRGTIPVATNRGRVGCAAMAPSREISNGLTEPRFSVTRGLARRCFFRRELREKQQITGAKLSPVICSRFGLLGARHTLPGFAASRGPRLLVSTSRASGREPHFRTGFKGHIWKGTYHTGRALMNCIDLLDEGHGSTGPRKKEIVQLANAWYATAHPHTSTKTSRLEQHDAH